MQKANEDDREMPRLNRLAAWIFGTVVVLWLAWLVGAGRWLALQAGFSGEGGAGQFGDMFGGINALFTALAFGAVTWSAFMQRREMEMQREEMRMQRRELELQRASLDEQRNEMERQRNVFAQQAFETTFFQLLNQCRELHAAIGFGKGVPGGIAMKHFSSDCLAYLKAANRGDDFPSFNDEQLRAKVGAAYELGLYQTDRASLGPYYRSLYHLISLIDNQPTLQEQDKRRYSKLARAHLSADDALVLAVNCCSTPGLGFRPHIEKYGLLKHVEITGVHLEVLRRCYGPAAFGELPSTSAPPSERAMAGGE